MQARPDPGTPGADLLGAALRGPAPFLVLAGEPGAAADLEAAIAGLDPAQVAIMRIRNPLATPLSPHRTMLQLAPDDGEAADLPGDDAERLLRTVAARAAGRPALLVVVEQSETLTPDALSLLQLLPRLRAPGVPSVRVAFQGTAAFRALLHDPRFRSIRDHLAEPSAPSGTAASAAPPPPPAQRPSGPTRLILGTAAVAASALLAAALLPRRAPPVDRVPVVTPAPAPPAPAVEVESQSAALAAQPPAAGSAEMPRAAETSSGSAEVPRPAETSSSPAIAEDPAAARARLSREFNAFMEARGLAGRLSRSDRDALFQEYLARRSAAKAAIPSTPTAAPPAAAASDGRKVVLFFPNGRSGAEAEAEEQAVLLRQHGADVTLQATARSPSDPTVNYFRPEDRGLAKALALALPSASAEWQVVDMSGTAARPARPTVEVWLPRPRPAP